MNEEIDLVATALQALSSVQASLLRTGGAAVTVSHPGDTVDVIRTVSFTPTAGQGSYDLNTSIGPPLRLKNNGSTISGFGSIWSSAHFNFSITAPEEIAPGSYRAMIRIVQHIGGIQVANEILYDTFLYIPPESPIWSEVSSLEP